jgi:O-antigen/teichoic acid export membrane protein
MSNTKIIARNTGWYGLENIVSAAVSVFTSIAIARTLGPSKMGYFIYVAFIASVVSSLGGLGIPATTQKYMAEYLGSGDHGTARHIYFRTLWLQVALASVATAAITVWVLGDAGSGYRLASVLVALSIWPAMVNFVPAQANVATEELSRNLPASVISIVVFFLAILGTVAFHWGIVGVGASLFLMRFFDCAIRIGPTTRRILTWEGSHVMPEGLRARMISFAWQSVASMIVAMVVWDRSELFLLEHLCSDIRQVAYYSVAFSMGDRLLLGSSIFASATGATIFAQYGRDKSRLPAITAATFRYLAILSIPVHFIFATLGFPLLLVLYGNQYQGAAMVVTIAPILCLPKAFIGPVQSLLQTNERQSYVIVATVLAGLIDIAVASLLIPWKGAVGACIGSGAAQITAVGILWAIGIHLYRLKLPWGHLGKITIISIIASVTAHYVGAYFKPLGAVLIGGTASLIVLLILFYAFRVLDAEDRARFRILTGMLPGSIAGPVDKIVSVLTRSELVEPTPTNV